MFPQYIPAPLPSAPPPPAVVCTCETQVRELKEEVLTLRQESRELRMLAERLAERVNSLEKERVTVVSGGLSSSTPTKASSSTPTKAPLSSQFVPPSPQKVEERRGETQFWCVACGVEISGMHCLQAHNRSDKHERRKVLLDHSVAAPPDVHCPRCNIRVPAYQMQRHINSAEHFRSIMSSAVMHHCDVCDVDICGEANLKMHLAGSKHKSRLVMLGHTS